MAQNLTEGRPFTTILTFSLPVIAGSLFQLFYTLADSVIVGQTLGADALAAVGATGTIVAFILCFVQGLTGGFGICLGHQCGRASDSGMRHSIAISTLLSLCFTALLTTLSCILIRPILYWLNTPNVIYTMAYDYLLIIFIGTGATIFYNMISNMLRALGDSRTPLIYLIFSSLLNIILDLVFILAFHMGVAGAAWATVLSQLLSAALCTFAGWRKFSVLRLRRSDWRTSAENIASHLKIGLPMGFQMSVMCIGLLAMQGAVNALGPAAIAGYTAATKVDQLSVLINTAFSIAISSYVAQNYGAGLIKRIRSGVTACLIQTSLVNLFLCALILSCRNLVVPLFVDTPTATITNYASQYLLAVAPFYLLLGVLVIYRTAIQSMNNTTIPFLACIIELFCRISATFLLAHFIGYIGVCLSTPLAWIGACLLLIPAYWHQLRQLEQS